ncbi:unnamed protein product [Cylindrotheca closterium]|uniref:DUF6824 domain-containing protein n=1 Tax=Cylindrotheca closterium TaxID=2856 RepID=A0AAD2G828_9STRA|nr:unnamed protein product [Cylindrotheca closterium]CAJ1952063.1 unnamed protein product [Cylindrotheca closterium]CAJ1952067.1 unnamed protein product [Cylindrotheca closterium]CAJ1965999.1 unnamed protein product [Cylindrotheca closterium]
MSSFRQSFDNPTCFCIGNERTVSPGHRKLPQGDDGLTTEDRQKTKEIDDLLSLALKGLSFKERQEQQDILHGVAGAIAEEATFIEASLQELESHLSNIKNGSVYEMAENVDPDYVIARAFRVMFLRGARYNSKAAANQMLKFFEMKHQLFGRGKLVKDITLDDLDEGDIACLKTGWVQLAGKDRSGRQIILNLPGLRDDNMTLQNELRMRYTILMSALESEETQIKGIVPISYAVGDQKSRFGGSGYYENAKIAFTIPNHMAALHLCTDEISEHLCHHCIIKLAPMKIRARYRIHYGSQTECLYRMSSYGIPNSFLQVDPNTNTINRERHLRWVESRYNKERGDCLLSPVVAPVQVDLISPTEDDVLFMGGIKCRNLGNQRFRVLVNGMSQGYQTGSRGSRRTIVDCIIHSINESGGRFLKQHPDGLWRELPEDQTRNTITQAFRNTYRRQK